MSKGNDKKIDQVLAFEIIKRLVTPIKATDAFKRGIVDEKGKLIKEPEGKEDERAYTVLDKLMFKLKRLLGGRLAQLNNFLYVQTLGDDIINNLIVKGSIERRPEVLKVKSGIEKLKEETGFTQEEILEIMTLGENLIQKQIYY